jgi:hypothetical protein
MEITLKLLFLLFLLTRKGLTEDCHPNCKTCFSSVEDQCTSCNRFSSKNKLQYSISQSYGQCVETCGNGYFYNENDHICTKDTRIHFLQEHKILILSVILPILLIITVLIICIRIQRKKLKAKKEKESIVHPSSLLPRGKKNEVVLKMNKKDKEFSYLEERNDSSVSESKETDPLPLIIKITPPNPIEGISLPQIRFRKRIKSQEKEEAKIAKSAIFSQKSANFICERKRVLSEEANKRNLNLRSKKQERFSNSIIENDGTSEGVKRDGTIPRIFKTPNLMLKLQSSHKKCKKYGNHKRFGKYRSTEIIGIGAFATVYKGKLIMIFV